MTTTTVSTALDRIARLIPVRAAGSSHLTGDYAAVCTPWQTLPEQFQAAQRDRTAFYMTHGGRVPNGPDGGDELATRAPRYVVTSYGVPIAWVTLDGRTHFADLSGGDSKPRAMWRHQTAIRAAWPERFALDGMGDPQTCLYPDGVRRLLTEPSSAA